MCMVLLVAIAHGGGRHATPQFLPFSHPRTTVTQIAARPQRYATDQLKPINTPTKQGLVLSTHTSSCCGRNYWAKRKRKRKRSRESANSTATVAHRRLPSPNQQHTNLL